MPASDALATIREYHTRTKHRFDRFARSLGYLDWANQPDPFRSFEGARRIDLVAPLQAAEGDRGLPHGRAWTSLSFDDLFMPAGAAGIAPGLPAVSAFLRYSLGLSAWKQAGASRWALRVNPSSGNLHPCEGYVICGPGPAGSHPGVFHYAPEPHALEERCLLEPEAWERAAVSWPPGSFLAALTSIHWREAWKYGERAFRYCQHDVGHAVAAMRMAAALIGWRCAVMPGWRAASLAALLGLDRHPDFDGAEAEEPGCLLVVSPSGTPGPAARHETDAALVPALAEAARRGRWSGRANRLSADRVPWDWIDAAAEASRQAPETAAVIEEAHTYTSGPRPDGPSNAAALILGRRSAMTMDGHTSMALGPFAFMMGRLLPAAGPPFDALPWTPRVHLVLFVHRVSGLLPGIYVLPRTVTGEGLLRRTLRAGFAWERPAGVPDTLPLFLLEAVDGRQIARQLSCGQDIAGQGCFSLGMLAEFDTALTEGGPAAYRRLFWEAGAIGHALYLEAEAAGVRGTGIGCYFDDAVHELLGIAGSTLQSLYHFTVGVPVDDPRLTTHPGYPWEKR